MAQGYRVCKVCGEQYPYCKTNRQGVFRWQDVACCEEHAKIYFDLVAKARGEVDVDEPKAESTEKQTKKVAVAEEPKARKNARVVSEEAEEAE